MYLLNSNIGRATLITAKEVIRKAPVDQSIDSRILETSIEVAEERYIRHALGGKMYEDMTTQKNVTVTDDNLSDLQAKVGSGTTLKTGDIVNASELLSPAYLDLWTRHLWKVVAEAVYCSSIATNYAKFTSQGMMQNNPSVMGVSDFQGPRSASIGIKDAKWMLDKAYFDRVNPLISAMQEYICNNKVSFPLYGSLDKCRCDDSGNVISDRKSPIMLSMYDDDDDTGCGCHKRRNRWS